MKFFLSFIILLSFVPGSYAQSGLDYNWNKSVGGLSYDYASAVTSDKYGNVYVAGQFESLSMDFDPGTGVDLHMNHDTHEIYRSADVFLSKYDENGNYLWTKSFGGISNDYAHSIAVDEDGYVYVAGQFAETVDFDPGPGEYVRSAGHFDSYVTKFSPNGVHIWARVWGGANYDQANSVVSDKNGHIYVSGGFQVQADFDPGEGVDIHTTGGSDSYNFDPFISKFQKNGTYLGVTIFEDQRIETSACDSLGNLYVAGDLFLRKYNNLGHLQWTKTWGMSAPEDIKAITTDADNNLYITGTYGETTDFDPGAGVDSIGLAGELNDIFLSKFDAAGGYVWTRVWGGVGEDERPTAIATSKNNQVFVVGRFEDEVDFDPGEGVTAFTSNGRDDVFLVSYTTDGDFNTAKTWGSAMSDYAYGVTANLNNSATVVGMYQDINVDFDPDSTEDLFSSNGLGDIFIANYLYDECPEDATKLEPGICGCAVPELDENNNQVFDCLLTEELKLSIKAVKKADKKNKKTTKHIKKIKKLVQLYDGNNSLALRFINKALRKAKQGDNKKAKLYLNKTKKKL